MNPKIVALVLMLHVVLLSLFSWGINGMGLVVLLMMPMLVLTGTITYNMGRRANNTKPVVDPRWLWRA